MIDERQHRVKAESPFEVRGGALLFRVCPDQGGVQIDDHLGISSDRAVLLPHHRTSSRPRLPDRGDCGARVLSQGIDEPTDRRIRGHHAEQLGLSPYQRGVSQAVPTQGDRDGQIQHRLTRIVDRACRPPRAQLPRQHRHQTADLRRLHEQRSARRRNQRLATRLHPKPTTPATLHLRSAFPLAEN